MTVNGFGSNKPNLFLWSTWKPFLVTQMDNPWTTLRDRPSLGMCAIGWCEQRRTLLKCKTCCWFLRSLRAELSVSDISMWSIGESFPAGVEQISKLVLLEEDSLNAQVLAVIEIAVKLFDCAENEQDRWDCVTQQLGGGGLWIAHVLPIARSSKRRAHKDGSSGFTPSYTGLSPALYFGVIQLSPRELFLYNLCKFKEAHPFLKESGYQIILDSYIFFVIFWIVLWYALKWIFKLNVYLTLDIWQHIGIIVCGGGFDRTCFIHFSIGVVAAVRSSGEGVFVVRELFL